MNIFQQFGKELFKEHQVQQLLQESREKEKCLALPL